MSPDFCAPAAFVFTVAHIRDPLARAQEDAGGIAATVGQTLCGLPMSVAELWQLLDFDPAGKRLLPVPVTGERRERARSVAVSGAGSPRQTEYYRDAVIAARGVIERETTMRAGEADRLAEAVAERLLGDFLALAWVAFTPEGTGPVCTWCGALAGPRIPPGHPQYGIFCTCRRPKDEQPGDGDVLGLAKPAEVARG